MRTLRLWRTFDAVSVHDETLPYLTSDNDLAAAIATAYAHCRPGRRPCSFLTPSPRVFRRDTDTGGHDGTGHVEQLPPA